MTNFYEEFKLEKTAGLEEIQKELVRQESTWKRREITNPEKATRMLALLIEARDVFSTDASRRAYDNELDNIDKPHENSDPSEERAQSLKKWHDQALSYYNEKQYDLAKTAIEKALAYIDLEKDNDSIFVLAADIYREVGDCSLSLDYINKAIIVAPDIASYYLSKGLTYDYLASESKKYDYSKAEGYYNQAKDAFRTALSKADLCKDNMTKARALGALSLILYYQMPMDKVQAEDFALQTLDLGGDPWGNAQRVLDDINEKRTAEENQKLEQIYQNALKEADTNIPYTLEQVANKFDSIKNYKDSAQKATQLRKKASDIRKHEEDERKEREHKAEEERKAIEKRNRIIKKIAVVGGIIATALIIFMVFYTKVITPNAQYSSANRLLKEGKYEEAIIAFQQLNGFRNSEDKINECYDAMSKEKYDIAVGLMNEGKYEDAISVFESLGDYGDSVMQASSCQDAIVELQYEAAVALMDAGKYEDAIVAFEKLNGYGDSISYAEESKEKINQLSYEAAVALMQEGKYDEAISAFSNLGDFSDSKEKIGECEEVINQLSYDNAMDLLNQGQYKEAYTILSSLGDFSDSKEKIDYLMNNTYLPLILADIGETITFGSYEQDADHDNGKEPIEWIIIKKDNDKLLLISKYLVDCYRYNDVMESVTWLTCSARSWLNDSFYNEAFTSEQQQLILNTEVIYSDDGSTATDKVFFLSKDEAFEYLERESDRATTATEYAAQRDKDDYLRERPLWMLRTIGKNSMEDYIDSDGTYTYYGNQNYAGVRPVIWIGF